MSNNRPIGANEARERYRDSARVHNAMQHVIDAFVECALANHYSGGLWCSETSDGMEWIVRFEELGVRNKRTGKIDKRNRPRKSLS